MHEYLCCFAEGRVQLPPPSGALNQEKCSFSCSFFCGVCFAVFVFPGWRSSSGGVNQSPFSAADPTFPAPCRHRSSSLPCLSSDRPSLPPPPPRVGPSGYPAKGGGFPLFFLAQSAGNRFWTLKSTPKVGPPSLTHGGPSPGECVQTPPGSWKNLSFDTGGGGANDTVCLEQGVTLPQISVCKPKIQPLGRTLDAWNHFLDLSPDTLFGHCFPPRAVQNLP